ncbi:MAG: two-component regulator propeller domain-containing protein, partial [Acidobacteriota bacterium]
MSALPWIPDIRRPAGGPACARSVDRARVAVWRGVVWALLGLAAPAASGESPGVPFFEDHSAVVAEKEVWAMAQDASGVMYLGTGVGLVEWDGVTATVLPLENGSIVRSVAVHRSGTVYVGGIGEIGALRRDVTGRAVYAPMPDPGGHLEDLRDVWRLWPTDGGFLAWTLDRVLEWDGGAFTAWPLDRRTLPGFVDGRLVLADPDGGLLVLDGGELKDAGALVGLGGERVRLWLGDPEGGLILGTSQGHLWRADGAWLGSPPDAGRKIPVERFATAADAALEQHRLYDGRLLRDGTLALGTMAGGAVGVDLDGRLRWRLERSVGLPDSSVWSLAEDRQGGLWLGLSRGAVRVGLEVPLRAYGEILGLDGKVQAVARVDGRLWAATSVGLFWLDGARFRRQEDVPGPCWALLVDGEPGSRRLLAGAAGGVYEVKGGVARIALETRHAFALDRSGRWPGHIWVGTEDGVAVLGPSAPGGRRLELAAQGRSILEAADGALWVGTLVNGVKRLDAVDPGQLDLASVEAFAEDRGLDAVNSVKLFLHGGEVQAATGFGLRRYDVETGRFVVSELFGAEIGGIARVARGEDGRYWLSRDGELPVAVEVAPADGAGA